MSRPPLEQLREVLEALAELVQLGRERYDADRLVRWSIERLWILAGNLAEVHCQGTGMPTGVEPWSELIAERNVLAHYAPDDITPARLWFDTISDLTRLQLQVEQAIRPSDSPTE